MQKDHLSDDANVLRLLAEGSELGEIRSLDSYLFMAAKNEDARISIR